MRRRCVLSGLLETTVCLHALMFLASQIGCHLDIKVTETLDQEKNLQREKELVAGNGVSVILF